MPDTQPGEAVRTFSKLAPRFIRPTDPLDAQIATIDSLVAAPPQRSQVLFISPELAAHLCSINPPSRPLRPAVVSDFASDMRDGVWMLNGDNIKFDERGNLFDGHHRLTACVWAGAGVTTHVVFNIAMVAVAITRGAHTRRPSPEIAEGSDAG